MNNSVFGKTMENVKNRMSLHLTTDNDNAIKWFSKANLKDCKYYNGLYMIELYKTEIIYNKPIYVGTGILDLSKLCMMEFHYDVIHENFKDNYNLIYSDTDSLVYSIQHPDIYEWIKNNKKHFDLSGSLRPDLKNTENNKVVGKFKDELNSLLMTDFIALNPKVYSFNYQTMKENKIVYQNKKTLKGVSKAVVKNEITYQDYEKVHKDNIPIKRNVTSIRSFNHNVVTFRTEKIALTSDYDKMKMIDGNTCVPFGYNPA